MSFIAILLPTVKDILMGMLLKVAFKPIFERFVTRVVIAGLRTLAKMSSNDVVASTIDDIIRSLQGKPLKVLEDIKASTL